MAQWSKKYTPPEKLNGGNEYTEDSDVTLDTFNVANNNAFYAVEQSTKATETANKALEHAQKNGTQTFINNKFQSRLDFTSDPQAQIDGKTTVNIGGVAQSQVNFTSDPQTQLNDTLKKSQLVGQFGQSENLAVNQKTITNNLNAVGMTPSDNFIDNIIEKPTNTGINYSYTAVANGYIQINIVPTSATETIYHSLVINKLATAGSNYGYSGSYYMALPIRKGQTANFAIYNNIDKIGTFSARFIYAEVV